MECLVAVSDECHADAICIVILLVVCQPFPLVDINKKIITLCIVKDSQLFQSS